ncbi:Hsp20/alpha crystallin family protein, partial [Streptomyces griseocarneus]
MRAACTPRLSALLKPAHGCSGEAAMPMDAYREGDEYVVAFDLPGVTSDAIDIDVERNMLTVKAERRPVTKADDVQMELSERPL